MKKTRWQRLVDWLRHSNRYHYYHGETLEERWFAVSNGTLVGGGLAVIAVLFVGFSFLVRIPLVSRLVLPYSEANNAEIIQTLKHDFDSLMKRQAELEFQLSNVEKTGVKGVLPTVSSQPPAASAPSQPIEVPPVRQVSTPDAYGLYLWAPARGAIRRGFDPSKGHYAVDIAAPILTTILAPAAGTVVAADYTPANGYSLMIQHVNGLTSVFKHAHSLFKKPGDRVQPGETVALVGNSGDNTSGPHVHFELWKNGKALDPAGLLSFQ
jgi:murein DD-endopeptidase MepM/ murein hydrolase activator NlpD